MKNLAITAVISALVGGGIIYVATDHRPAMAHMGQPGGAPLAYQQHQPPGGPGEGRHQGMGPDRGQAMGPMAQRGDHGMRGDFRQMDGKPKGERGKGEGGKDFDLMNADRAVRHLAVALDLSASQQDAIKALIEEKSADMGKQRESRKDFREQMSQLDISSDDYSQQAKALIEENSKEMAAVMLNRVELKKAIYGELSEAQQQQFQDMQTMGGMRRMSRGDMPGFSRGGPDGMAPGMPDGMGPAPEQGGMPESGEAG